MRNEEISRPELLLQNIRKAEEKHEGKWIAMMPSGETLAVAKTDSKLWRKIHEKVGTKNFDIIISYSQTAKERKSACLLLRHLLTKRI